MSHYFILKKGDSEYLTSNWDLSPTETEAQTIYFDSNTDNYYKIDNDNGPGKTPLTSVSKCFPKNCNNPNGWCNGSTDKCICTHGWSGDDCSTQTCPNDCSGHGKCLKGVCNCDTGWTGDDCSIKKCPNNCSGHGTCVDGLCKCSEGWSGDSCLDSVSSSSSSTGLIIVIVIIVIILIIFIVIYIVYRRKNKKPVEIEMTSFV